MNAGGSTTGPSVLVVLLLLFYVINAGSAHGVAWIQGLRLIAEPLLLLLVGIMLPDPRRTFRWALTTLIATCCAVAAYGLVQQLAGKFTLVEWGYSFEAQVRSLEGGQLRSFGTLDDSFAYAALLAFGIVAIVFWVRRGIGAWLAGALILVGLAAGLVRTSALMLVGFAGLLLRRWGYVASAILFVAATVAAGIVILVNASGSQSQGYTVASSGATGTATGSSGTANVVLNGRVSAWEAALGPNPVDWLFGRGVGEVGTAAARSGYTIAPTEEDPAEKTEAVDSGYLATIADVGIVGLVALLASSPASPRSTRVTLAAASTRDGWGSACSPPCCSTASRALRSPGSRPPTCACC